MNRNLGSLVLSFVAVAFALAGLWAGLVAWRSPVGLSDEESLSVILPGIALGTATAKLMVEAGSNGAWGRTTVLSCPGPP